LSSSCCRSGWCWKSALTPTLLTQLEAHAPEFIYNPDADAWYITTAGWPWVATLTSGEVAVVPLKWEPLP